VLLDAGLPHDPVHDIAGNVLGGPPLLFLTFAGLLLWRPAKPTSDLTREPMEKGGNVGDAVDPSSCDRDRDHRDPEDREPT